MPISVFLSTVSDEFRPYRDQLTGDLTRPNVSVMVQEHFKDLGGDTLDKLDVYIAHCDAVVHLVGDMCGSPAGGAVPRALLAKYPDLVQQRLAALGEALKTRVAVSYTHWEAWLALYHGKQLYVAKAAQAEQRGPNYRPTEESRAAQAAHFKRLKNANLHPFEFTSPDNLAKQVFASGILELLVKDYAQQEAHGRAVAELFIEEMAKRVAGDKATDLDGKKQAVRNAIEIYEKEIAGRPVETNLDGRALSRAKELVDKGQSGLARATLRRAAEEMRREEDEHRERHVVGVTELHKRWRDIALAAYDGDGAAEAMIALADDIHGSNATKGAEFLKREADVLYQYGDERGSNVHLAATISLQRELLRRAGTADEQAAAHNNLGIALAELGERENGTARLEEAVKAYRAALEVRSRERAPLDWALTQNNLGNSLATLGERESGTARLEEAVAAYRAALEERTRERVPLGWALTQNNLGNALARLGGRESGTEKLEEAVEAYRAALEESTREWVPLDWAMTQNNLGNALATLDEREGGTARLEEAVAAYRAALEERTRERLPLDWAATQTSLGSALFRLGERESGTARLMEAVAAYRKALEEVTREHAPLQWATTQSNLGNALASLGERESETAPLQEAVKAYRAALEERMRERVPLDWARTQMNLGIALATLGERESGTEKLEQGVVAFHAARDELTRERVPLDWAVTQYNLGLALTTLGERESGTEKLKQAVAAYRAALEEMTRERVPIQWAASFGSQGGAMILIADRTNDGALAETAVTQIAAAYETLRDGGQERWAAYFEIQLPKAQEVRDRLGAQ